ncbi:mechanosensitive ion channel family protein [Asticcacaulis sp. 201]|uniref:mechanosensitive ion channel family protein n=1 Tax=Asticcacaulis sp. 201 TaxID=3028787 RepID=UPI002915DEAC|nr:mechanosensitive ion channel domain-containing protein [Asticcacaulis sp. 201]MDV6330166.1 mechanosensitive ion channel [Asticcacaulis sp. 201]
MIQWSSPSFPAMPDLPQWAVVTGLAVLGFAVGAVAGRGAMAAAQWLCRRNPNLFKHVNLKRLRTPLYTVIPILCAFLAVRAAAPQALANPIVLGVVKVVSVGLVYWLVLRIIDIVTKAAARRYDISVKDNLRARQARTQITVIKSIAEVFVFLLALSAIFLMFDTLRGLGVSLLASAGVAGIVLGFAAQKTLGNLLAGIQIALTQPIRIEDAIVVENEWGWVEEITLTYVVVRLWDLRRLVLPISYFIEKPFQNWTRTSANIIGTVELYADFALPIDPLREELKRLLAGSMLWDGKTQVVQVTEVMPTVIKIRVLVSAVDSPTAFDLRCLVREHLTAFIVANYPHCLPRTRAIWEADDDRNR